MCIGMANWSDTKVFSLKYPLIAVRIVRITIFNYIFLSITLNIILLQGINILFVFFVSKQFRERCDQALEFIEYKHEYIYDIHTYS